MESVLVLNHVEQLELWLEALVANYRLCGQPLFPNKLMRSEPNYREELSNSLLVIQDVLDKCPKILELEAKEESREGRFQARRGYDLKEQMRRDEIMGKRLADLFELWDFLLRYRIVGASMTRHPELSRQEFKAFGSILADQIGSYCRSETHVLLMRRYHSTKYHHVIHRDILHGIEIDGSREELEQLFLLFFKVLATIDYFQSEMQRSFKYQKLVILLSYCHFIYTRLLKRLEQTHEYLGYCQPQLAEGLASIKFALRMEVRRIFGQEFQDIDSDQKIDRIYSQMDAALGLLKNTSQQSFTALVHFLNPDFNEMDLFRELRRQRVDSERLVDDLHDIYAMIKDPATRASDAGFQKLLAKLKEFIDGSMKALFYKDWKPFEQFHQEFSGAEPKERAFILHRFEVFVSTLLGEVAKRSVLTRASRFEGANARPTTPPAST